MTDPLLIDLSPWSRQQPRHWFELAAAGAPWHGGIIKSSEGHHTYERWRDEEWFAPHWRAIAGAGRSVDRPWFRGAYHFLLADGRGAEQADVMLDAIERAGGWDGAGDLFPIVDLEEGSGNGSRFQQLAKQFGPATARMRVIDTVEAFAARVLERIGRPTILYAGWWLRSIGVTSRMGCEWLWYAAYTRTLPASVYRAIGWDADRLLLWQYDGSGDSDGALPGYPTRAPIEHGEDVDINVLTLPGGVERLAGLLTWAERPAPAVCASGPER